MLYILILNNLIFSDCEEVTDRGISSLSNLEKLTFLSIESLPKVRNPPLEKLKNLLVLGSRYNANIQEECFCSLLKKAHQLRALDVTSCTLITKKLLNVAIQVTKKRNANNALELFVRETGINMSSINKIPALLNINQCRDYNYEDYGVYGPLYCT